MKEIFIFQVTPIEMVNIAKWIHLPYKIARAMMPAGFSDRFRLHDGNFLPLLQKEINIDDIPTSLGGKNEASEEARRIKVVKIKV